MRANYCLSSVCLWVFIAISQQAHALEANFRVPEQIDEFGKTFRLSFTSGKGGLYEYTTEGETVDNWSTLITITYAKGVVVTPMEWAKSFAKSAARETPHYSVWIDDGRGYAKVIYEPDGRVIGDKRFSSYEVDAHKTYHVPACRGLVTLQYATRPDVSGGADPAAKRATLLQLASEAERLASAVAASSWAPDCEGTE